MSNLIDIQTQIQKLQKQASEIKAREFDATVRDILTKMEAFGISIKDLQGASSGRKARGRPAGKAKDAVKVKAAGAKVKKAGAVVAAKYKGPNGETWTGRGLTPRWLAALVAQGQAKEDFAIKA
ncbi:MAG: nucleoid-structuring protein H-NS [Burkholderiales bacterium PBB4]|nr:MAG: nucleoid-structuring protein H-NS [Burkholderiales bacterium PBB4]